MSLTSHLKNTTSPIGQFIRRRLAHTANLTKDANLQLRSATTLRPSAGTPGYPYSTLGIAIDYRIRYSFAITPPQYLVAWKGAKQLAPGQPAGDTDLTAAWIEFNRIPHPLYPLKLIEDFFVSLETTLHTLQPVGQRLELKAERTLAHHCYVLALFEEVCRRGLAALIERSPLFVPKTKQNVEELLDIPQAPWIDDLCAMSTLFCERYQELFLRPRALNPTFVGSPDVGGAAADMVVGGCLIDMKATIQPRLDPEHLYQLAGYLLLDYTDRYHINAVGIYMVRQGVLFTWPVSEFLRQLTGDDTATVESLRQAFRAVCETYWNTPPLANDMVRQIEREKGQSFQIRVEQVRTLQAQGMEREAILRAVWGVKRDSTTSYKEASREYDFIEGFLQK